MQMGADLGGGTHTGQALLAKRLLASGHFGMSQERWAVQTRSKPGLAGPLCFLPCETACALLPQWHLAVQRHNPTAQSSRGKPAAPKNRNM